MKLPRRKINNIYRLANNSFFAFSLYIINKLLEDKSNEVNPKKKTTIFIVGSSMHLLLCYCISRKQRSSFLFLSRKQDLNLIIDEQQEIIPRSLSVHSLLIALIITRLLGRSPSLWIPHVSPHILSPSLYRILADKLIKSKLVFFDDGLSSFLPANHLHHEGYVPANSEIFSWDYSINRISELNLRLCPAACLNNALDIYSKLDKSGIFEKILSLSKNRTSKLSQGYNNSLSTLSRHDESVIIILASKLLDYPVFSSIVPNLPAIQRPYYIPHYVDWKNDQVLLDKCHLIAFSQVELLLLSLAYKNNLILYFGITSSVFFLVECLLRRPTSANIDLRFVVRPSSSRFCHDAEIEAYINILRYYQVLAKKSQSNLSINLFVNDNTRPPKGFAPP